MIALFEKLPMVLVAAAVIIVALQVFQMVQIAGQTGPTFSTVLAMTFGLLVQAAKILALAALVHYAQRIAINSAMGT